MIILSPIGNQWQLTRIALHLTEGRTDAFGTFVAANVYGTCMRLVPQSKRTEKNTDTCKRLTEWMPFFVRRCAWETKMHVSVAWLTLGLPDRGKCPRMKARANARREYKVVLFRGHLGGHVFFEEHTADTTVQSIIRASHTCL